MISLLSIIRSNSNNQDFIDLVTHLDADLDKRYGLKQAYYTKYNHIESLDTIVIAYAGKTPVGCGCFKEYDNMTVEIKRIYVKPENRGLGIAKQLLTELENWAIELGYVKTILETGINQPEAIGLYHKQGYARIDNYGQYVGLDTSICFGKDLKTRLLKME